METTKDDREGALRSIPQGSELVNHEYTEADIRWLEGQDLTIPDVVTALRIGYRQNDPEERREVAFKRSGFGYSYGTEAQLRQRIDEADGALRKTPKHCDTRVRRLMAMVGLAYRERRGAGATAATA